MVSQLIHFGEAVLALVGYAQHFLAFLGGQEFAVLVEQLQRIPLFWIVAGGKYQATASILHSHCYLGSRGRSGADIDHVEAHAHQCSYNHINHHRAGDAGIMAYNDGAVGYRGGTVNEGGVCCRIFYNIYRRKCFAGTAADSAAYTGNGFYKGHNWVKYGLFRY